MSKACLVCVDDEDSILRSLKRALKGEPYEVITFLSPAEALRFVEQRGAAVVMSDFRMPEMNGGDFLRAVAQFAPGTVRVILSGYADGNFVEELRSDGIIHRFLAKPWEPANLRAQLRECFESGARGGIPPRK